MRRQHKHVDGNDLVEVKALIQTYVKAFHMQTQSRSWIMIIYNNAHFHSRIKCFGQMSNLIFWLRWKPGGETMWCVSLHCMYVSTVSVCVSSACVCVCVGAGCVCVENHIHGSLTQRELCTCAWSRDKAWSNSSFDVYMWKRWMKNKYKLKCVDKLYINTKKLTCKSTILTGWDFFSLYLISPLTDTFCSLDWCGGDGSDSHGLRLY